MTTGLEAVADRARALLPEAGVITDHARLRTYECDGLAHYRVTPALVVIPEDTAQLAAVVRTCAEQQVPFVARGSGTGLSGGALPHKEGVLIVTSRMREIREVRRDDQRAVVEPGVINLDVTKAATPEGYYYAPDPSSQQICSIGGNVAENSGGAHCLKYGFTTNHVLAAEFVTPQGDVVELGGAAPDTPGYDLLGAVVGSEGTLGIVTSATVKLVRLPEEVRTVLVGFETTDHAGAATSAIISAGIVPAAIEMMDALAIEAAEEAVHCNYPEGAGAVLVIELDGPCGRGRCRVRRGRAAVPGERLVRAAAGDRPRGAGPDLEGPQVRVRGRGPDQPRLHRAGRRHPPDRAARGAQGDRRPVRHLRGPGRERLPRRRRQPASAGALRRVRRRARARRPRRSAARSSTSASSTAAPSPASTAWAWTSRSTCRACTTTTTSTPCRWSAAPSTRTPSPTPARCSRPRGCAARSPAGTRARTRCKRPGLAEVF